MNDEDVERYLRDIKNGMLNVDAHFSTDDVDASKYWAIHDALATAHNITNSSTSERLIVK